MRWLFLVRPYLRCAALFGLLVTFAAGLLQAQTLASAAAFHGSADSAPVMDRATDSLEASATAAPDGWSRLHGGLATVGLTLWGNYVVDGSANLRGGMHRGTAGRALLTTGVTADLDRLIGLGGGSLEAGFFLHDGADGSALTGDIQAFSNIDAPAFGRVAELFYAQELGGGRVLVRLGRMDANSEFATVAPAGEFINASAGFSPTIYGLPTYPDPQAGVTLSVQPFAWLSIGAGAYRGPLQRSTTTAATGAVFGIGEVRTTWAGDAGRAVLGYWRHDGYAPTLSGDWQHRPQGWYASLEQRVSGTAGNDSTDARGLTLFAKVGSADERISPFTRHLMLGAEFEAPFGWTGHGTGVLLSQAGLSRDPAAGTPVDETTVELFYRLPVTSGFTLRPDLQYIVTPGGISGMGDAVAATLRLELGF